MGELADTAHELGIAVHRCNYLDAHGCVLNGTVGEHSAMRVDAPITCEARGGPSGRYTRINSRHHVQSGSRRVGYSKSSSGDSTANGSVTGTKRFN